MERLGGAAAEAVAGAVEPGGAVAVTEGAADVEVGCNTAEEEALAADNMNMSHTRKISSKKHNTCACP